MASIKKIPISERPYEKFEMFGEKVLSNSELLAIILKTGTKNQTALELAQNILIEKENLRSLQNISLNDLKKVKGIGRVKAIQIKAVCEIAKRMARPLNYKYCINEPKDVANLLMDEVRYERREIVKILILNTKNILQKNTDIAIGNISSSNIQIRQVFEEIIKTGMEKFILVHNHPSGNSNPSTNDIEFTKKLKEASEIMGIQFLDHIIIGDGEYTSIFSKINQKTKNNLK